MMRISNEKLIETLKKRVEAREITVELCQDNKKGIIEVKSSKCSEKIGEPLTINLVLSKDR